MTIARRFNAGSLIRRCTSPEGTAECLNVLRQLLFSLRLQHRRKAPSDQALAGRNTAGFSLRHGAPEQNEGLGGFPTRFKATWITAIPVDVSNLVGNVPRSKSPWVSGIPRPRPCHRKWGNRSGLHFDAPALSMVAPSFSASKPFSRRCRSGLPSFARWATSWWNLSQLPSLERRMRWKAGTSE